MIESHELYYTYPGNRKSTLNSLSFKIPKGNIFGFLGPSGAGKSTTQKLATGLLSNYSGSLKVNGVEMRNWNSDYYNLIGVGFELPNHYLKLSAIENLEFFKSFYNKPISNLMLLLEMVGLEKDANKRVEYFSKGMKMRLNFVRAIMHDPEILFLDEPTAGLDPLNARNLKNIILDMKKKGKTIFFTTHNMHDADELCDTVAFISEGKISAIESPSTLKYAHSEHNIEIEYEKKGNIIKTIFPLRAIHENKEFHQILKMDSIIKMHSSEATLEQVFIKLTGRKLQ